MAKIQKYTWLNMLICCSSKFFFFTIINAENPSIHQKVYLIEKYLQAKHNCLNLFEQY